MFIDIFFLAVMRTDIITWTFNVTLVSVTFLFSILPLLASFSFQFFFIIFFLKAQLGWISTAPVHAFATNRFWWRWFVPPTAWTNVVIVLTLSLNILIWKWGCYYTYIQYNIMHTWTIPVSRRSIVIRDNVAFISNVIVTRCFLAKYMYCYENLLYVDRIYASVNKLKQKREHRNKKWWR